MKEGQGRGVQKFWEREVLGGITVIETAIVIGIVSLISAIAVPKLIAAYQAPIAVFEAYQNHDSCVKSGRHCIEIVVESVAKEDTGWTIKAMDRYPTRGETHYISAKDCDLSWVEPGQWLILWYSKDNELEEGGFGIKLTEVSLCSVKDSNGISHGDRALIWNAWTSH